MKKNNKYNILICISIIMIISLLNMINTKLIDVIYVNHFIKQFIWYIIGFTIIFVITKINVNKFFEYSFFLYLFSIILLILVLFIGTEVNGAKAWFSFYGLSFQPSEFTKLTLSFYLTYLATKFNNVVDKNHFKFFLQITIITTIPSILVFIEPDTGAIIFYLIIYLVVLFYSKIKKLYKFLFIISLIGMCGIFAYFYLFNQDILINLIGTSFFYRIDRLIIFSDNYQITNALTLIGSASFFGSGINEVALFVPESPTDFIYAFNIGNYGIFSGIFVTITYLILDILLILNYKKTNNKLFALIFIYLFIFQQLYNILMNIGLLPIMGIPLPFLSYGGSALIIYFIFIGTYLKLI